MGFDLIPTPIPPKKTSIAPQLGAKHFDIVLGLDFHTLKVPPLIIPCPVTPFAAIVFSPMDYIHITIPAMPVYSSEKGLTIAKNIPMGGTVLINGCYRAAATSGLMALPPTLPLGGLLKKAGFIVKPPNPLHFAIPKAIFLINFLGPHDGQISHGSESVFTQQMEQSALMSNVWSCSEIGQVVMNNPTGLFFNMTTKIIAVLPIGDPVMIGGPFVEHKFKIDDLINALIMMAILKGAMYVLGKILDALLAKLNEFLDNHPNIRDAIQPLICTFLGEPVDVASGYTTSLFQGFSLPGPIPFKWEANYYSDSKYDGPLGKSVYHSYDFALLIDEKKEFIVMRDNAGRAVPFPTLEKGKSFFNPIEKLELHRSEEGEYYVGTKNGLYYYFTTEKFKDGWQQLRSIANRNGFAIRFFYNSQGRLIKITDSAHRNIEIKNNEQGFISEIILPHPDKKWEQFTALEYEYDEDDRIVAFYDALRFVNRLEWKERLVTVRQFKNGTIFNFHYDKQNRCVASLGPNGLYSYRFEYKEGVTIVENSLGYKSSYYHKNGIVIKRVDSRGAEKTFTYDFYNNLIAEQDALGNVKSYEYDERGNLINLRLTGQGSIKATYNKLNLHEKTIMPNGAVWQYEYDTEGNLIKKINPLGATSKYEYLDGLLRSVTVPSGKSTSFFYDEYYNITEVKFFNQTTARFKYDIIGRCVKATDILGNYQTRSYDLNGNVVQVNKQDGNIKYFEYDSMANIIHAFDKLRDISLTYDSLGNLKSRAEKNCIVKFKYNSESQLISIENSNNEFYTFQLDGEGNVTSEKSFDGIIKEFERNILGQVITENRPNGKFVKFEYNSAGKTSRIWYSDGNTEEYEYDCFGNTIKAKNTEVEVILERNLVGRITTEKQNQNFINSHYNISGKRIYVESNLGANIKFMYNNQTGWHERIVINGWNINFSRNDTGSLTSLDFNEIIKHEFEYDKMGRIIKQSIFQTNELQNERRYLWNVDLTLTEIKDSTFGNKLFKYDLLGNLTEAIYSDGTVEYRIPDFAGNLFETKEKNDRKYGNGCRLIKKGLASYKYDEEGNLIEKKENTGQIWKYEWSGAGMLVKVIRPDLHEISFGYDSFGRRIWKKYKNTITKWLWDGHTPLHEWKEHALTGDMLSSTEISEDGMITWLFEVNSFIPLAKIKGDKKYSIITDHLGTPFRMYQDNGDLFWQCDLNTSGKVRMLKGERGSCPFRYQGQYEDVETGLYYNKFRYYCSTDGVYISQDPIRLHSNNLNLYSYVKNTNIYVDPSGLSPTLCEGQKYLIYTTAEGEQRIIFRAEDAMTLQEATPGRNYSTDALAGLNENGEPFVFEGRHRAIGAAQGADIPPDLGGRGPGILDFPYTPDPSTERGIPVKDLTIDSSQPDVSAAEADRIRQEKYGG
jgi:RHS repeat-associated protein